MVEAQDKSAIEGEYLLMLEEGTKPAAVIEQLPLQKDHLETRELVDRMNIWLFTLDNDASSPAGVLDEMHRLQNIKIAQRNHTVTQRDTTPDDPFFSQMWGLKNSGQSGGKTGADISASSAWKQTTGGITAYGDTIVVAVIDGGFDLQHDDLSYWKNDNEIPANGVDDDNNGYVDDFDGWDAYDSDGNLPSEDHGTHVSGIAGAMGDNKKGVTGVNWDLEIMPIAGSSNQEATVLEAYGYALKMRALYDETDGQEGAFVVATNSSFGVNFGQPSDHPLWCAFYDSLGAYGILNTGATINSSQNIDNVGDIPTACSSPWLISVTNTTRNDQLNNNAGFGPTTIDLAAPGTDIYSTVNNNDYDELTGTSMATPHIAGAIGLLYSLNCQNIMDAYRASPSNFALTLKNILLATTDNLGSLQGKIVSDGRLNVNRAIDSLKKRFCRSCVPININKTAPSCNGKTDGKARLVVNDTTSQYQVDWSNGNSGRSVSGLEDGTYQATIEDTSGCAQTFYIGIDEPEQLSADFQTKHPSGPNQANGKVTAIVSGGSPPYSYLWSEGAQTTATATTLKPGTYHVTITDSQNCSFVDSVRLKHQTGIAQKNTDDHSLQISPNPAHDKLYIRTPIRSEHHQVSITNAMGKLVYADLLSPCNAAKSTQDACTQKLDISELSKGIYFLQVKANNGQYRAGKFIVR